MNQAQPKKRIMLVRSSGQNQATIDEIMADTPQADYVVVDDNREGVYGSAGSGINSVIGCPRALMTPELIALVGPSLQWIHSTGAGCENFFFKELVESPLVLTNGRIIQGPEVADHAFALLLALTRNLHFYLGHRSDKPPRPLELFGKTVVVFGGGGGIGLLICERAAAFGMKVVAVDDDYVHMTGYISERRTTDNFLDVLPQADVVLNAAPSTAVSRGTFNRDTFAAMKKGAYFINVSRGSLVVTDDLVAVLNSGQLTAAGLDVTDPEPLPADHVLRTMPNVILTPHIAGLSEFNRQRSLELVKRNIRRFVRGLPLFNVVDKQRQY